MYPKRSFAGDFRPRLEHLEEYRKTHPIPESTFERIFKGVNGNYNQLFAKYTTVFPNIAPGSMLSAIHLLVSLYSIAKDDQRPSAKSYVESVHRSSAQWKALFHWIRDKEDDMQVNVMVYAAEVVSSSAVQSSPVESEVLMKTWLDGDILGALETSLWLHISTHLLPCA